METFANYTFVNYTSEMQLIQNCSSCLIILYVAVVYQTLAEVAAAIWQILANFIHPYINSIQVVFKFITMRLLQKDADISKEIWLSEKVGIDETLNYIILFLMMMFLIAKTIKKVHKFVNSVTHDDYNWFIQTYCDSVLPTYDPKNDDLVPLSDEKTCCVCLTHKRQCINIPCGHYLTCLKCMHQMKPAKCMVCAKLIHKIVRVYD